ncbi:uncharacterized protein LOC132705534 [Cylas formicarius]|uniref:uncharacterized protein LOC132705534 n=1 Tax=Cylas formicarius TaxID=197179 RepID=UPI002958D697|nr:uncharacterized protein LOC132705534 [Cylas formicarius]
MRKKTDFESFIIDYIADQNRIIEKFEELKKTISNHHHKCNIVKTAGTAVSGTGVACVLGSVLLAPMTSGSSLILGTGGAIMSVTGGLSNVITDYVEYKTSNMVMEDIQNIIKSKGEFDKNLQKQLDNLEKIVNMLVEDGIDRDTAIVSTIKGIALGCIDLTEEPTMNLSKTLSTVIKLHHIESAAHKTLPIIEKAMHVSEKSFQFIYNVLGLTGKSAPHLLQVIGRISSMVSVAFTVIDVGLLIRDWTSEHPSVEVIDEVQKKLEVEKNILKDLLEVINTSKDTENVLYKVIEDIRIMEDEDLLKDFEIVDNVAVQ